MILKKVSTLKVNITDTEKIVSVRDLTFAYSGSDVCVLDNISLDIFRGELAVIMGSSGSGKTTFLKMLKKNIMPAGRYSGDIKIFNKNPKELTLKEQAALVGYVSQNPDSQIVTDKVWHELAFGLENLGYDNQSIRKKVAEMSEYFGITGWYEKDVSMLSGGQKQILNLASVMVMQPKVLLLDEPTANLDPLATVRFLDVIKKINEELDVTVIIVEHNLEHIYANADRVIAFDNGKIISNGNPRKVAKDIIFKDSYMKAGLPVAARLFAEVNGTQNEYESVPLTVKEGRIWYRKYNRDFEKIGYIKETNNINLINSKTIDEINGSYTEIENDSYNYKVNNEKKSRNPIGLRLNEKSYADDLSASQYSNNKILKRTHKDSIDKSGQHKYLSKLSLKTDKEDNSVSILKNITYAYDKGARGVLEDVNVTFEEGKITAILGANGSGKSTMLKLIAGIIKSSKGKIINKRRVIMLPQDPKAVFTEISVEEELAEVLMDKSIDIYKDYSLEEKKKVVEQFIEKFGLSDIRKNNPYDISGGQQEKLALAKVLLLKPEVLLLDEPTNALDPYFKQILGNMLRELNEQGMTIIMVSHDLEFVDKYTDECIMVFDRNVVDKCSTKDFLKGNMFYTTNYYRIISE